MWDVLAHPVYRRLFTAQVVALVGTGLLTIALGLLAYDIAGEDAGAVLGTALAIKMVAYVVVAPVITAVTERLPRRAVMVSADAVRAVIALMLPFIGSTWQIYVLIFVLQAASATFTPTFQAVIPSVLTHTDDYTKGLSLSRLAYDLESLTSPAIAGALLLVISYNQLFVATALGFLVSAALVISTRLPRITAAAENERLRTRITKGARVMVGHAPLRGLLALNMVVATATGLVVVNTVVYVRSLLGGVNAGVAMALAAYGGGSMLVALAMPRLLGRMSDRRVMMTGALLVVVGLVCTAILLATSVSPVVGWVWLITAWTVIGAATSAISTPTARLLRDYSTESNRPAVFTAQFSLSHACFLVTYPLAGWVGAQVSQLTAAIILATLATLSAMAATRLWPATYPRPIMAGVER
ncbi:MFS transporter [Gordonia amicalis]|uniref:MFS transporter n=1 Tax=Gordonia amicalis TaxID=89053 RepID=UPI0029541698|nr:MFS transporter [Gordonia amicalis]MDV7098953.1 MFS transporter [Gordonia amicalis]